MSLYETVKLADLVKYAVLNYANYLKRLQERSDMIFVAFSQLSVGHTLVIYPTEK